MSSVRNWYIYIVCAISLQAVTWSTITLLRNLFVLKGDSEAVAFQIAMIIIGLPVFLVHWLWAQRLTKKDVEERGGTLRRLYLYGMMAVFLGSFVYNAFYLFMGLFENDAQNIYLYYRFSRGEAVLYYLIPLFVLALVWFYHWRVVRADSKVIPEAGSSATIRRLYVLGFSATGLTMTIMAIIYLIRWLMQDFGGSEIRASGPGMMLINEIIRLVIGAVLWVLFWRWAQRLFYSPSDEEHNSALRKFYLYAAVFIGVMATVVSATLILASLIRRIMGLAPSIGEPGLSMPLPIMIGMGILWAYHAFVLRQDTKQAGETNRQAGVRRLYYYLVAAVGLSALLVGLSGTISILLRSLDNTQYIKFSSGRELSWYIAAIIAGLPVWIIPWRNINHAMTSPDPTSVNERRSVVRKIYLYFFLFVATMTILGSAVYIVFRIINMFLGADPPTLTEMGYAISLSLIATVVLLYHGNALRDDSKYAKREQASLLNEARVIIVDVGDRSIGPALTEELKREIPELSLESITLTAGTDKPAETDESQEAIIKQLTQANLIVGPWMIAVAGGAAGVMSAKIAEAVVSSAARKLLIPFSFEGWDWAGMEYWDSGAIVRHTTRAVKQVLAGEQVKLHRPMSAGAIIGIILGSLVLLYIIAMVFIILSEY